MASFQRLAPKAGCSSFPAIGYIRTLVVKAIDQLISFWSTLCCLRETVPLTTAILSMYD